VRSKVRTIDRGARRAVTALNRIPGIATRGSCEGIGLSPSRHRHADLAYVVFRHPLPLRAQAFLVARLETVARVEDDGVYSRWPTGNRAFLDAVAAVADAYRREQRPRCYARAGWPLAAIRARCARALSSGRDVVVALCVDCAEFVFEPHASGHQLLPLLRLPANQTVEWFAAFVGLPRNRLAPELIVATDWSQLVARSQRGDFGVSFHRRWLRYRANRIADLTTHQIRRGVQEIRLHGCDLDFFYDATHAVFTWPHG